MKLSASKDLPIKDGKWDKEQALKSLFEFASKYPDKVENIKDVFLVFNENGKGPLDCSFPFGFALGDKLFASNKGLKEASESLNKLSDFDINLKDKAKEIVNFYENKLLVNNNSLAFDSLDPRNLCLFNDKDSFKFADSKDPNMPNIECEIDMLRTGKFLRDYFWFQEVITITEEMIDTMMENFNNGVVSEKISLDINHGRRESYGWLKSLRKYTKKAKGVNQVYLAGKYDINKAGRDLIENQIFKYYSIEFHPNYEDHEVFKTVKRPDGTEEPTGEKKLFGPTILGGALTNRPFIPNLNEGGISFSKDFKDFNVNSVVYIETNENTSFESPKNVVQVPENNQDKKIEAPIAASKPVVSAKLFSFDFSKFKTNPVSTTEKRNPMDGLKEAIKFFESQLATQKPDSEEYKNFSKMLEKAKNELKEFEEKNDKIINLEKKNNDLSQSLEKAANSIVKLEEQQKQNSMEIALQKNRARVSSINEFCSKFTSKGFPKPVVDKAKEFMMNDIQEKNVFEFTDEKNVSKKMRLEEVIVELFNSFPAEILISTQENLSTDVTPADTDENKQFLKDNDEAISAGMNAARKNKKNKKNIESDKDMN